MTAMSASDLHQVFCRSVRERRIELGMRQKELAERTGMSRPQVSQIESGLYKPSLETLVRLAEVLQMEPHDLLNPARFELAVAA